MERVWIIERDESGYLDHGEVAQAAVDAAAVVSRLGGVVGIAADRVRVTDGDSPELWETDRIIFRWDSFAPGRRPHRDRQKRDSEPEPVAVEG